MIDSNLDGGVGLHNSPEVFEDSVLAEDDQKRFERLVLDNSPAIDYINQQMALIGEALSNLNVDYDSLLQEFEKGLWEQLINLHKRKLLEIAATSLDEEDKSFAFGQLTHSIELSDLPWLQSIVTDPLTLPEVAAAAKAVLERMNHLEQRSFTLHIGITEKPLTAYNLNTFLSAIVGLHTKCWLISKERFADLIEYTQTHNPRFDAESRLVITKLSYNSPFEAKLDIGSETIRAITAAIESLKTLNLKEQEVALKNQQLALDNAIRAAHAQEELASNEQKRGLERQTADLERQEKLLDLEAKRLDLMARQLEYEEKRLVLLERRWEVAAQIATKTVEAQQPKLSSEVRSMAIASLQSDVLQLTEVNGLELTLPLSTSKEGDTNWNSPCNVDNQLSKDCS